MSDVPKVVNVIALIDISDFPELISETEKRR